MLGLWEGWCVFPQSSQEHFSTVFANPPLTKEEEAAAAALENEKAEKEKAKSRWKTVDERNAEREAEEARRAQDDKMDVDDLDGEPMAEDDLDGEPMLDDKDIDGEPMADSDSESNAAILANENVVENENQLPKPQLSRREALAASIAAKLGKAPPSQETAKETAAAVARRRRPKAEDMFADSDGE